MAIYSEQTTTILGDEPQLILRIPGQNGAIEGVNEPHIEMEPNAHVPGGHLVFSIDDMTAHIANCQAAVEAAKAAGSGGPS
jgi:hypothetical protein